MRMPTAERLHNRTQRAGQRDQRRRTCDLFLAEAAKYQVLPLDDRFAERLDVTLRPSFFYGRKRVSLFPGTVRRPEGSGPQLIGVPFRMTTGTMDSFTSSSGTSRSRPAWTG